MADEIDRDVRGGRRSEVRKGHGRELEIWAMFAIPPREHRPRRGRLRQARATIAVAIVRGQLDRTYTRHGHEARDDDCPDRPHSCP
ncbi:MAG: hypothetical protein ABJE66_27815 [Deltaproteobacteria bacterium]